MLSIAQLESEIMLGYETPETKQAKAQLLSLLRLARELRRDRELVIDRQKNVSYIAQDPKEGGFRYVSLLKELTILVSQIPQELPQRLRLKAAFYLKSLYEATDITIINITKR